MKATHLEILVEEPSMEAFLRELLPRVLGDACTFEIYPSQCKDELMQRLPERLRGYAGWLHDDWRIMVVIDRDDDDCKALKHRLERIAADAGLRTRTSAGSAVWQVVNRIAIEELEAWYFGDWQAVCDAYPGISPQVPRRDGFRDADAVRGGTWEAFERLMKNAGHFRTGLRKIDAARTLGRTIDPNRATSNSFIRFREALLEAIA